MSKDKNPKSSGVKDGALSKEANPVAAKVAAAEAARSTCFL